LRANGLRFDALKIARRRRTALRSSCFTSLAPLGLVFEALIGEEHLFAGSEDEFSPTVRALQDFVVIFHGPLRGLARSRQVGRQAMSDETEVPWGRRRFLLAGWHKTAWRTPTSGAIALILFSTLLLTETFTREGRLGTTTFSGLHEVRVLLDFLDDVFGLHFPLEAPKGVFQRFALLDNNFSHAYSPPSRTDLYFDVVIVQFSRFPRYRQCLHVLSPAGKEVKDNIDRLGD
jgi:hypothetical protein